MGYVITIFRFVVDALTLTLKFIVGLPGMVVTAFTGIALAVSGFFQNVFRSGTLIIELLDAGSEAVTRMMEFLNSVQYYGIFHYMFAFDILGSVFSSFLVLASALIVVALFDLLFSGFVVAVPFFILKTVRSLVSLCSAGLAKP